jgi:protein phosphatase
VDVDHRPPLDSEVDVFGMTHRGKVRRENQDHFVVCSLHKSVRLHHTSLPSPKQLPLEGRRLAFMALVADGVGSHAEGETASRLATQSVIHYVSQGIRCYYTQDPAQERGFVHQLYDSVMQAHHAVETEAEHQDVDGMATTLTLIVTAWPKGYVVQVGDSRCYRLRGEVLERITSDQTVAQALADEGALTQSEADRSQFSNVLTSSIGGPETSPVVSSIDLDWEDVLLLCSDGLTRHVQDDEIQEALANLVSAEATCRHLVDTALERGGQDNITVVIGRAMRAR